MSTGNPEGLSIDRALKELGLEDRKSDELRRLIVDAMESPGGRLFELLMKQEIEWALAQFLQERGPDFGASAGRWQGHMLGVQSALYNWNRLAAKFKESPTKEKL